MTQTSNGGGQDALDAATTSGDGRKSYVEVVREAPIADVVVHARGAVVTRRFFIDESDPAERFALVCPGVTMSAEPSSVRCRVDAGRSVSTVTTRVHIPEQDDGPGPSRERVAELDRKLRRLNDEHAVLVNRLEAVHGVELRPLHGRSLREQGADGRVETALAMGSLVDARAETIEARLAEIEKEHRRLSREREQAALDDMQTSAVDRKGTGEPTREIVLLVEPGASEGAIEISYTVGPARWWPAYTLRVEDEGKSASLLIEANVAQDTGEDWEGVKLGLATSEIVSDAQLPRLPSYRLGRAQPDPPRAFRPPPKGVERLFAAYDLAMGPHIPPMPPEPTPRYAGATRGAPEPDADTSPGASFGAMQSQLAEVEVSFDADMMVSAAAQSAPSKKRSRRASAPPPPASAPAPMNMMMMEEAVGGGGMAPSKPAPTPTSNVVEPADGWLDFDEVVLASAGSTRRGKLERKSRRSGPSRNSLNEAAMRATSQGAIDPFVSRGNYDHRYDCEARVDVPSDGALHRVEVALAACPSSLGWRSNPREDSAVYREVTLDNPFPSPLLAGPLDVYVRGSLVANTELGTVDRGGTITAGLGVDERIRIARNARVREESAGLLGGKREIDHFIDIDIASSLGFDAMIEIVDRIPVTNEEHVDVEMFECVPQAEAYDQADRDAPVEGGYRWRIEVLAGDEATIRFAYRITLRAKDELVGGNRRD